MTRSMFVTALGLLTVACVDVRTPPATAPGPDFLMRNAAARRVVSTASGLQYFVVRSGSEAASQPKDNDLVTFHYEGKLLTGETFDSSFERGEPISGQVGSFVQGFNEALKLMRPGDEWIIWIPPELGYGNEAAGPIPANSILRFRLAMHSVQPAEARAS